MTRPSPCPAATTLAAEIVHDGAALEGASALEILRWAIDRVPRFAVTSSFGADSAVLLHLAAQTSPDVPVLFLDTGFHFPETLAFRRDLVERLGLTAVRDLRPELTVTEQAQAHGAALYLRDPDRCCALRKVEPLDRALAAFDGWATGVRRDQTADRSETPVVGLARRGERELVKVAPLAAWSAADVEAYREIHDLPTHPLAAAGFPSIGCAPCTRPAVPGSDPRAGRWSGMAKTECGIHLEMPADRPTQER